MFNNPDLKITNLTFTFEGNDFEVKNFVGVYVIGQVLPGVTRLVLTKDGIDNGVLIQHEQDTKYIDMLKRLEQHTKAWFN